MRLAAYHLGVARARTGAYLTIRLDDDHLPAPRCQRARGRQAHHASADDDSLHAMDDDGRHIISKRAERVSVCLAPWCESESWMFNQRSLAWLHAHAATRHGPLVCVV